MQLLRFLRIGLLAAGIASSALGQDTPPVEPQTEARGLPARAAPSDYQAQAKAKTVTIAAEFKGHSVPTMEGPLTTDDYVVVEAGIYGAGTCRNRAARPPARYAASAWNR